MERKSKRFKMKKIIFILLMMIIPLIGFNQNLSMPGDNFNLFAVLKAFQESPTLEVFEEKINSFDSKINNLDLDFNNQIDYISVIEYIDIQGAHLITLQIDVSEKEKQDVAVITVQKINNEIKTQIIGDEELYGKDYIVEPGVKNTKNTGYIGNEVIYDTYDNINNWPIIIYMYNTNYNYWVSSYHWGYYPQHFRPWNPYPYYYYYGYHKHNHGYFKQHFKQTNTNNYANWYNYYGQRKMISNSVISNRNKNIYKKTYSNPDLEKQGQRLYNQEHSIARPQGIDPAKIYKNQEPRQIQQRQEPRQVQQRQEPRQVQQRQEPRQVPPQNQSKRH